MTTFKPFNINELNFDVFDNKKPRQVSEALIKSKTLQNQVGFGQYQKSAINGLNFSENKDAYNPQYSTKLNSFED